MTRSSASWFTARAGKNCCPVTWLLILVGVLQVAPPSTDRLNARSESEPPDRVARCHTASMLPVTGFTTMVGAGADRMARVTEFDSESWNTRRVVLPHVAWVSGRGACPITFSLPHVVPWSVDARKWISGVVVFQSNHDTYTATFSGFTAIWQLWTFWFLLDSRVERCVNVSPWSLDTENWIPPWLFWSNLVQQTYRLPAPVPEARGSTASHSLSLSLSVVFASGLAFRPKLQFTPPSSLR